MRASKVIEDQDDKDIQTSFVNLNDDLDKAIKTKNNENECGDLGEKLQSHNDELDLTNETQPLDENDNCELGEKMLNEEEDDELINQQSSNSPGKLTKKSIKPKKKKKKPKTPEELERDKLLAINEK